MIFSFTKNPSTGYILKCRIPDIEMDKRSEDYIWNTYNNNSLNCYSNNTMRANEDASHYTTLAGIRFELHFDKFQPLTWCQLYIF